MDENTIKREVKQETEDDLNDGECVDVFGETAKPDIFDDSTALVKPELLAEVHYISFSQFIRYVF